MADNIKVVIKVRPLIKRELDDNLRKLWEVDGNSIYPIEQHRDGDNNTFTFDHIFDCQSRTRDVYDIVARPIVEAAVDGINGTIFAYGQTSSGKTFTMMGDQDSPGVIPLAVQNIFSKIESMTDRDFLLRVSYIEIYNEKIKDLLDINNTTDLKIHEDYSGQLYVKAKEEVTSTAEDILELMKRGNRNRAVGETQMNERSSRSHTIFYIIIESRRHVSLGSEDDATANVSQLNLVDLAGSERAAQTGATKQRLREGGHINKSLSSLGLVIRQLSDPNRGPNTFISFRDSKLTLFLRNSLGGNSKTGIICAVTPAVIDETQSSLMFAMSAKVIQNIPKVNAVVSDATLIKKLTKDMAKLQEELENKRLLENDNKKLQEQLSKLRNMILMGNTEDVCSKVQKAAARRRTWCVSRTNSLPPISEHHNPQHMTLKDSFDNTENMFSSNVTHRRDSKLRASCDNEQETPRFKPEKEIDIIELDDTPDASPKVWPSSNSGSITPPTCSPNHKCFGVQQTPPCVLKYRAQHAEKEYKELQELTSLEKMYEPKVVELLQDITVLRHEKEECLFQIENHNKMFATCQEEIQELKNDLESLRKEKDDYIKSQEELMRETTKWKNINTDLQFEIETLNKRSLDRENELLASLKEAREANERNQTASRTSLVPQFLNMSRDLSLANSDLDTTHEDDMAVNDKDKLLSKLEEDLKAMSKEIVNLKEDLECKVNQIKQLSNQIEKNSLTQHSEVISNNKVNNENDALESDKCCMLQTRITELEDLIQKKNASHNASMEYSKSEIEKLTQTTEEMNMKNSELSESISTYEEQIKELVSKISDQQKDLETARNTMTQLHIDVDKHAESLLSLQQQNASYLEDLKSKDARIASLEEVNKTVDNTNELEQIKSSLHFKELYFENELQTKQTLIEELSDAVKDLNLQINRLTEEHVANLISKDSIISDLRISVENLQSEANDQKNALSNSTTKCQELERDIAFWKAKINETDETDELRKENCEITSANKKLTEQNLELENRCHCLENELCDLKKSMENKEILISSLTDENNNLNQLISQKDCVLQESELNVSKVMQDLQLMQEQKVQLEEKIKEHIEIYKKLQIENDQRSTELENLRKELEVKYTENSELNNALTSIQDELARINMDVTEKTNTADALQFKVDLLSQQINELTNAANTSNDLVEKLTSENNILNENVKNVICDVTNITNILLNSSDLNVINCALLISTDYEELKVLESEVRKLRNENILLKNENLLLENKENVSIKTEKTPLKSKYNQSFSNVVSPLDSIKSLKSPKCASPQNKTKGDIAKDLLDVIDAELENNSVTNLINPTLAHNAELTLVINKINKLVVRLQESDETNNLLKQKLEAQEKELNEIKNSLVLIGKNMSEIYFSVTSNAMYSNLYNTIKDHIHTINSSISQHLDTQVITNDLSMSEEMTINQDNNNQRDKLNESTQPISISQEEILKFTEFLELRIIDMCTKLNLSLEHDDNTSESLNVSHPESEITAKFNTIKMLHKNLFIKIENVIAEQNEKLRSLELEYGEMKNDKLQAETEIQTLCGETEELFKKIVNVKNEAIVSEAETTLKSSVLCATEHYHNNLHSTIVSALSFIKENLIVLQTFLQNPDITQRDFVDIYCNITNPGLEIVETPLKHCSPIIYETRPPKIPVSLFSVQEDVQMKVDRSMCTDELELWKTDYESKCLENKQLSDKLKIYEPLIKQYDDLVNERDSLSTQLMDSLEDIDNLKSKCTELKNKLDLCKCMETTSSNNYNVSIQTENTDLDKDVTENSASDTSVCFKYILEKLLVIKKDIETPSNLMDLLSMYVEELNIHCSLLQADMETLKNETASLQTKLESKINEITNLEEKITNHDKEKSELLNILDVKSNNIVELEGKLDINQNKIIELCSQLEEQAKFNSEYKICLTEKETVVEELKIELHEKTMEIEKLQSSLQMFELEKTNLKNEINTLETKVQEVQENAADAIQISEEYVVKIKNLQSQIGEISSDQANIGEKENSEKARLQELLSTFETKTKELENINVQLESEKSELIDKITMLLVEQTQVKNHIDKKDEDCKTLQEQIDCMGIEVEDLKKVKQDLQKQVETHGEEKTLLLDRMKEMEERVVVADQHISNLKADVQKYTEEINILSDALNKLKEQETLWSSSIKDLTNAHQDLSAELESKQAQLLFSGQQIEDLQNVTKEKDLILQKINEEYDEKCKDLTTLRDENSKVVLNIQQLEHKQTQLVSLEQQIEDLQSLVNEKDMLLQKISAEYNEKSIDLYNLKEENSKHASEKKVLEEEKLSLLSNNENMSRILNEKDSEINEKIHEISQLKSNIRSTAGLQFENEKLKHEIIKKNESISQLEDEMKNVNNKLNGVTSQLVEMSGLKSINTILEGRVSDLQNELNSLLRSSTKHRTDHLHLKRQSLHDMHRNLSLINDNCNDVSMEDCSRNNDRKSNEIQELEEKYNKLNSLYSETLDQLSKKSEEYANIGKAMEELQMKYDAHMTNLEIRMSSRMDASTNTCNNRLEDNGALTDMFVDKLTHNHLKEKFNNLSKINEELRIKLRTQATELRRLHSLQNTTHILPREEDRNMDEIQSKLEQSETEVKTLKKQLVDKQKEFQELEQKYNEMDKEYDTCASLYHDSMKAYNELSSQNYLLEAKLKDACEENSSLKRNSPGRDSRRKRQSMQDHNRGLPVTTSDSSTNTSPKNERFMSAPLVCVDCEKNKMVLQQLKIQYQNLLTQSTSSKQLLNPVSPAIPPSSAGGGIVQNHHISDYIKENQLLKLKLAKYKEKFNNFYIQHRQQR